MTQNPNVLKWIDEMKALVKPDKVVWIDGSEEQLEALRAEACSTGEMYKLNQEQLPGCYLHRTDPNDVARVENQTFIWFPPEGRRWPDQQLVGSKRSLCETERVI